MSLYVADNSTPSVQSVVKQEHGPPKATQKTCYSGHRERERERRGLLSLPAIFSQLGLLCGSVLGYLSLM